MGRFPQFALFLLATLAAPVRVNACVVSADATLFPLSYGYDHRGPRVIKNLSSLRLNKTTTYIWDDWNIIRETQVSGVRDQVSGEPLATSHYPLVTDYVWGLDLDGTLQGAGGVGGLLAVLRSDCTATNSTLYPLTFTSPPTTPTATSLNMSLLTAKSWRTTITRRLVSRLSPLANSLPRLPTSSALSLGAR